MRNSVDKIIVRVGQQEGRYKGSKGRALSKRCKGIREKTVTAYPAEKKDPLGGRPSRPQKDCQAVVEKGKKVKKEFREQ